MKITPLYYLSIVITSLILVVSIPTFYHQYCYLTNNTFERIMRAEKSVHSSNSKRQSNTIEGKINNQNAYFALYDYEQYDFLSYLKEDTEINYDNLKPLKLDIRVAQFGTSKNVEFIKQNETKDETVKDSILPFIILELIAISITTLFYLFHKKSNRVRRLNS